MCKLEKENEDVQVGAQDATLTQNKESQGVTVVAQVAQDMNITSSLEGLQTEEQRRVLDTVAQVRKCGLESILSLPQLVVCGDQSAGKSSVLEALTEIPFPRNDNLCTRYATEIILRRAATNSLTIKVIPDTKRPAAEQTLIKAFNESITDFTELSRIMSKATDLMGLDSALKSGTLLKARAFAKDILSIEIEGPSRPQLTLVDIPGLIQTETKGVTKADVDMVTEITDQYISQPRTICLAVVSAANDYANQGILTKVRKVDPDGERTLGIITKPDRLPSGSGSEAAYLALASNKDIFFKLGWHVIKNRSFEEGDASFEERNASEATYFSKSNFKSLPPDCVGIDPLRLRLSALLFEHVKKELPKLREDLEEALSDTKVQLDKMGNRRTTPSDCRTYLAKLSLDYYEICKSAVNGHYESGYFTSNVDPTFTVTSPATIRRVRAVVQYMNTQFSNRLRTTGHKYHINMVDVAQQDDIDPLGGLDAKSPDPNPSWPIKTSKRDALKWVGQVLTRTRGKELVGNFNPLLIGELFWEQCSKWRHFATVHVQQVAQVCSRFLEILLQDKCPADVRARLWSSQIQEGLQARDKAAFRELDKIMEDIQNYPINYNHYYTDTIRKQLQTRQKASLAQCIKDATTRTLLHDCNKPTHTSTSIDIHQVIESYSGSIDPDMENVSCEEALDCLLSIYKVSQKTFIANVTTQVVERHIVRGLESIFSPLVVSNLSDSAVEAIASEPASARRQREFLDDRISKLEHGQGIFRAVMGSVAL